MDWTFGGIPDWVLTTAVGISIAAIAYFKRQSIGLGDLQMATNKERDQIIELQERRIELLEEEVLELKHELAQIRLENKALRRAITVVEHHDDA